MKIFSVDLRGSSDILDKLRTTLRGSTEIISLIPISAFAHHIMSIVELFSQFTRRLEPFQAKPTKAELEIEENEIAEEIEVENEEVNAVNDHLRNAIEEKPEESELPTNLLAQFDIIQNLSLDAWAANTLRGYRG